MTSQGKQSLGHRISFIQAFSPMRKESIQKFIFSLLRLSANIQNVNSNE